MKNSARWTMFGCAAGSMAALGMLLATGTDGAARAAKPAVAAKAKATIPADGWLQDVQVGGLKFKSIGRMSFGPDGILLVADPAAASVVAIETGDLGPVQKLKKRIDKVDDLIAAKLGAVPGTVKIVDMAVNPKSGKIYLSVSRAKNASVLLTVNADGEIRPFDLAKARYVRVALPGGEKSKVTNITGVQFAGERVLAAGQCNEEFASKIYSLPLPLKHGASATVYSTETYHVAHGRWETRAPIQSFVPHEENGRTYIVGAFACTPIAKFPLDGMSQGGKVKGTSVVELGSGNQPLDMFTYQKDGKQWLVTNTYRFHYKKNIFGPSKWWGVRVDMSYLNAEKTNTEAARRDVKKKAGPNGIEIVDALFGAVEVDKLNDKEMVVLRDADGKLNLELAELP